ncbi:MAG: glycosyltransferase family 2 protein [Bacteroidales bacterium]
MKPKPDISFVTVNYNGIKNTVELIESVKSNLPEKRYEIIVVDNGSEIDEAAILKLKFPDIEIIRTEKNLGFSGGNNIGILKSAGRYIMLINNDTILPDSSLLTLVDFMDNNPKVGSVSPKIRFYSPENTIQFAGYTNLSAITVRNRLIGFMQRDSGQFDEAVKTNFTHGAAMMVRRKVIEDVGLMPEIYFLYYEELDWCSRMKRQGYEIWYQPSALIIHKESQSVGQGSYLRCYYLTRNRLLYVLRNRRGTKRVLAVLYQLAIATPKGIIQSLINGRFDLIKAYISGTIDLFLLKNKYS